MSKTTTAPQSVRVEIYDQSYHLRGTDPEYITKLGEMVDNKMRLIAQQTQTIDSLRLAVLAAVNLADEYMLLRKKYEALSGDYMKNADRLLGALDEVLEEPRKTG